MTRCFVDTIQNCIRLLGSEDNIIKHKNSILILITHLPEKKKLHQIYKYISKSDNKVIKALSKNFATYDPLDRKLDKALSRDELIKRIKNLELINNPGFL